MQWNQPLFGTNGFQSNKIVPPNPQVIGEGDVTAITFPDGRVQFYFIPITRHDLPHYCHQCNAQIPYTGIFSSPNNTEAWFVRSITSPQGNINISGPPGYCTYNNQLPYPLAGCPSYMDLKYSANTSYPEYSQKFHNDTSTSTSDIHYFYPSLRREINLEYCSETQPGASLQNINFRHDNVCSKPCHCGSNTGFKKKKTVRIECACHGAPIKYNLSRQSQEAKSESDVIPEIWIPKLRLIEDKPSKSNSVIKLIGNCQSSPNSCSCLGMSTSGMSTETDNE